MPPFPPALVKRTEFLVANLHSFIDFGESRIEAALEEERKEVAALDEALIATYGDDLWTDADVEFLQEQWGCDDPDRPDEPFSPYHYVFPRYLRYSFITLVALVFESELVVLCRAIAHGLQIQPAQLGGKSSALKNARAFLLANVGPASVEAANWDRLQDMVKVRNCIVHAGGRVDLSSDRDHLVALGQRGIGLMIDQHERPGVRLLGIERQYCSGIVEEVELFFGTVFDAARAT